MLPGSSGLTNRLRTVFVPKITSPRRTLIKIWLAFLRKLGGGTKQPPNPMDAPFYFRYVDHTIINVVFPITLSPPSEALSGSLVC